MAAQIRIKIQHNEFLKQKNNYLENEFKAFAKLWERYSKALQGKIESRIDYALSIHNNPINLREAIKEYLLSLEEMCYEMATITITLRNFILCK